jgi:hypothetical protein
VGRNPEKFWYRLIIIIIGFLSYLFVIYKLIHFDGWVQLTHLAGYSWQYIILFVIVQLVLMVVNIGLETAKWHVLTRSFVNQQIGISIRQVLSGFVTGIITPSRLGEPIGRLIYLPKRVRVLAVGLTFIGGFIQTIVIFTAGVIAFVIGLLVSHTQTGWPDLVHSGILIVLASLILLLALIILAKFFFPLKIRIWKRYFHRYFTLVKKQRWLQVVLLTVIRYFIFGFQLIVALCFVSDKSLWPGFLLLVPVYYFIITLIPGFLFTELGIRGSVAILLFGALTSDANVVIAVFFIWFINVALPTLFGATLQIRHSSK